MPSERFWQDLVSAATVMDVVTAARDHVRVPSGIALFVDSDPSVRRCVGAFGTLAESSTDHVVQPVDGGQLAFDGLDDATMLAFSSAFERAIRADRERVHSGLYKALSRLVDEGVIVATLDGGLPLYNDALHSLTGWSFEQVREAGWTNLVYPDLADRESARRAIAALVLGKPSEGIERAITCKDGTTRLVEVWSHVEPDPTGGAPHLLGVIRDRTSEQALRRREVREESMLQLGRITSGIAHEFNNLLAAIMGHAELIANLEPTQGMVRHVETIIASAERGGEFAHQLLAFSGTRLGRLKQLDVSDIVTQTVELHRPRLPDGIRCTVSVRPAFVAAESGPLQQAILNLLTNAVDVLVDEGTVEVTVDVVSLPEQVRYRSSRCPPAGTKMALIRVADSGPGLSATASSRVFEPFFTTKPEGHGMGLASIRAVVTTHHGAINVSEGAGAEVSLYLPLSDRPEAALPELASLASGSGRGVWLVDDNIRLLEFAAITLESNGYDVATFVSTVDAIAAIGTGSPPDVLVLDVAMPDGGGRAVAEAFEGAGWTTRRLWISGHRPQQIEMAVPTEDRFLAKPFSGVALQTAIEAVLATDAE